MSEGLLVRPADLVVLGVHWSGMQPVDGADGAPKLEAVSDPATLTVTFPPQHTGEETVGWTWWGPTWTSLAGEAPPGCSVAAMSTNGRLDVFVAADDGVVYSNRRLAGATAWQTDQGVPLTPHGGATFAPGSPLVAVGLGEIVLVFAVDDAGRLCQLVVAEDGSFGDWFPVDGGSGDASGFDPGADVQAVFVNGETNLFLVRHERLIQWSASAGIRDVRQLPIAARVAATQFGESIAIVVWVTDDGVIVFEQWDGTSWTTDGFGPPQPAPGEAPPPPLDPSAILHARAQDNRMMLFVVTGDGVLRAMSAFFSDGFWQGLNWSRLAAGFPAVTPITTQLLVKIGGGLFGTFKRPVVGVGLDGKVWATWSPNTGSGVSIEGWQAIGDWFPPGGRICMIPHGESDLEAFAVASDRTLRHAELIGGQWQTVPAGWEAVVDISRRRGRLAAPSQVTVDLAPGERVTLTADGVLAALAGRTLRPWPDAPPGPGDATLLELPWGLFVSPPPGAHAETHHATAPVVSTQGAVALWHSRLTSALIGGGGRAPAPLPLRAVGVRADEEGGEAFVPALSEALRTQILQASADEPFSARGTMLSALGGWLAADGHWEALDWEHRAAGGRDVTVRTVERGVLYPFGHAATYEELTTRRFDPRSNCSVAVLHRRGTLHVSEPLHELSRAVTEQFRSFPFTEVEIGLTTVKDLDRPRRQLVLPDGTGGRFFSIERAGVPLPFPVWLRRDDTEVLASVPLLFVPHAALEPTVDQAEVHRTLTTAYSHADRAALGGAPVQLAGDQVFETHELQLTAGAPGAPGAPFDVSTATTPFVTTIVGAKVGLPAVRQLTQKADSYAVRFTDAYRRFGQTAVLLETTAEQIGVSFAGRSDLAGGLATPSFAADAISGAGEPIKQALAAAVFDPHQLFDPDAKLLGIVPLADVIAAVADAKPPSLSSVMSVPPVVTLSWKDATCTGSGPFRPIEGRTSKLSLEVTATTDAATLQPRVTTSGTLTNFCLDLAGVLVVQFDQVAFAVETGRKPTLKIRGLDVSFAGDLKFLEVLREAAAALVPDLPVAITATPTGITASHHIAVPPLSLSVGAVNVSVTDLVFATTLTLPFDDQLGVDLAFASRKHPFLIGVWVLGGGGYLQLTIRGGKVTDFACAVEIGGLWSIDWAVVAGEVHALAGIDIRLTEGGVTLTGYLRVGGSVEVLGLVSVTIELSAAIVATDPPLKVFADARIVLDVDLFLVSTSVSLHETVQIYGEGSSLLDEPRRVGGRRALSVEDARAAWIGYRTAFEAPVG